MGLLAPGKKVNRNTARFQSSGWIGMTNDQSSPTKATPLFFDAKCPLLWSLKAMFRPRQTRPVWHRIGGHLAQPRPIANVDSPMTCAPDSRDRHLQFFIQDRPKKHKKPYTFLQLSSSQASYSAEREDKCSKKADSHSFDTTCLSGEGALARKSGNRWRHDHLLICFASKRTPKISQTKVAPNA